MASRSTGTRSNIHLRSRSRDTTLSGIADSTISFGVESLSQFPIPPPSVPTTPDSSRGAFRQQVTPRSHSRGDVSVPSSPFNSEFSPHDWHEGASSIYVDDAEDRLLSTSFITSLLREQPKSPTKRSSVGSDAYSGVSEMTYPPSASRFGDANIPPVPPLSGPLSPLSAYSMSRQQQQTSRTRSSQAFPAIPESAASQDDISEVTSIAHDESGPTVIRSARAVSMHDATVSGIAPATIRSIPSTELRRPAAPPEPAGRPLSRQSQQSTKSFAFSLLSKISERSRRIIPPWRKDLAKPLPPIPSIAINDNQRQDQQQQQQRKAEDALPLSHLILRATRLDKMLGTGHHPHDSTVASVRTMPDKSIRSSNLMMLNQDGGYSIAHDIHGPRHSKYSDHWQLSSDPNVDYHDDKKTPPSSSRISRKTKKLLIAAIVVVILVTAIGVGVGVSQSHKNDMPTCDEGLAGWKCNLNSTCVCTSSDTSRCNGLAQSIVDLTPTMNSLFQTNYSLSGVYSAMWNLHGTSTGRDCSAQSNIADVSKVLAASDVANRTQWASAALLWNAVQSQDLDATASLQAFINGAPWSNIQSTDGPVADDDDKFLGSASGFNFNFAMQTISQDAVDYKDKGQPSNSQISRVDDVASAALDRMYSVALAASTQRQTTLQNYWTGTMGQRQSDLSVFISLISSSTVLLPFDGETLDDVLASTPKAFPPPLSCYPNLSDDQVKQIDAIENGIFGLSNAPQQSRFDVSCYPDRPIYGVLDPLQLRLPFIRTEQGVALQAVKVNRDVGPRVVVRMGEVLSPLPGSSASSLVGNTPQLRDFGTLNNMDHVIYSWLSSMEVSLASAIASYILAYKTSPPEVSSLIVQKLDNVPMLEVAVFGSVLAEDIGGAVSSFATASGSLFFGSDGGSALRNFTIGVLQKRVVWAENSTSEQVAIDTTLDDDDFNSVWAAASDAVANNVTGVVNELVNSLASFGKMVSQ